jgi:hypothetical protein
MKRLSVLACVTSFVLVACGGTVETSSCGPSGCTSSRSGFSTSQPIGGSCANDGECQGSLLCATDVPNGYCTQRCRSTADCPVASTCVGTTSPLCFKNCSGANDCRPGYECATLTNGKRVCLPL